MTFEAQAAPAFDAAGSIFDFSRPAPAVSRAAANDSSALSADRPDPEAGWATRNPDKALLFLFVTPRDCGALDELLAL